MADDDDDPVVASYDVYLTEPLSSNESNTSRLFLLQYPAHRPYSKPYNAARNQTPSSLRLKSNSGFVEVDVPILLHEHYNAAAGEKYGKAMSESRTKHAGGTYGLAGGFTSSGHSKLRDAPQQDDSHDSWPILQTQTLGGKIVAPTARDPIYLLGCFRHNQIHLSPLDAVVQMRPQLHHIDAEEELGQKRSQSSTGPAAARQKAGANGVAVKVESKAIEIKIKDTKDDPKDRSLNENAKMLRDIQVDYWDEHEWIDEEDSDAKEAFHSQLHLSLSGAQHPSRLKSSISNGDWLDKMSAPREDGKKGLLAKLRGRERERARRKKAEEEKRQRQREAVGVAASTHGLSMDMSSDSDLSTPEASDVGH
ncbi:uncharacterized protein A1O9_08307 [Exophiala aquamarina CBS 119918]|uniref:Uncharacterized protein n=1 Tax=Exophiala aquamarina CBS 119918 TaxID=1182545 RepID=A0A072P755_9EURO|nr:uncharacterized protein A1O9_08307 [Exophiala aquamarina CBS 119918]KEF55557.1 hypothetical protein A1O9_08307 [Exophiala aquamarina CBS 119918]